MFLKTQTSMGERAKREKFNLNLHIISSLLLAIQVDVAVSIKSLFFYFSNYSTCIIHMFECSTVAL
jgi:hypothetical protein